MLRTIKSSTNPLISKNNAFPKVHQNFNTLLSIKDVNAVEKEMNTHKNKYLLELKKIKNYDKYVELYGDKEKTLFPNGIIPKFIHNEWCKLNPRTPLWSYPIVYKTAKEQSVKKYSEYVSVEEMCALDYAKETVKHLEDWFKKNNVDVNKYIN